MGLFLACFSGFYKEIKDEDENVNWIDDLGARVAQKDSDF